MMGLRSLPFFKAKKGWLIAGGGLSADGGGGSLPIATTDTLGVVRVGSGLNIANDGTLSTSGGSDGLSVVSNGSFLFPQGVTVGWVEHDVNFTETLDDTNYYVVTELYDGDTFTMKYAKTPVMVTNKTTSGFKLKFYYDNGGSGGGYTFGINCRFYVIKF